MARFGTARAVGVYVVIAVAGCMYGGCQAPTEPPRLETTPVLEDTRPLRVVMVVLDASGEAAAFASDAGELAAASMDVAAAHRVIVRDGTVAAGTVSSVDGGQQVELALDDGYDLGAAGSLGNLRRELRERFPAEREVLIVTGHGRDWRGFGLRDGAEGAVISPAELARALADPAEESRPIVVVDTPWSASGELLAPFSDVEVTMVVAPGPRPAEGIDYREAFSRLPGEIESDDTGIARHLAAAMASEGCPAGIVLTPAELALLPATITGLGDAGTSHVATATAQEDLQAALIRESECLAVPGAAMVEIGSVATLLSHAINPALIRISLYVTDVDRDGVPTGHRIDYRIESSGSGLSPEFRALGWAPDYHAQIGFLYRLWYHQF